MNIRAERFFKQAHFPIPSLVVALVSLALSICLLSTNAMAAAHSAGTPFFDDSFGDLQEDLETAKEEGKQAVMIFFEMDECPFCHRMKTTVFNKPKVQEYFKEQFRILPMDIEGDLEITDFQGNPTSQKDFSFKVHRVRATPVIAFFDLNGKKIASYTGATRNAKEFLLLGRFVAEGHYKTMRFNQFKRQERNK
ncbi:MAG: thioredoxin family protein [bacterium]